MPLVASEDPTNRQGVARHSNLAEQGGSKSRAWVHVTFRQGWTLILAPIVHCEIWNL